MLEEALLRRQEMLVGQVADLPAASVEDLRAKLELWAGEVDESFEHMMVSVSNRIVHSVLLDVRRLSA